MSNNIYTTVSNIKNPNITTNHNQLSIINWEPYNNKSESTDLYIIKHINVSMHLHRTNNNKRTILQCRK